jgi:hypothetical protein
MAESADLHLQEQSHEHRIAALQTAILAQRLRQAKLKNLQYQRRLLQLSLIKQQVSWLGIGNI